MNLAIQDDKLVPRLFKNVDDRVIEIQSKMELNDVSLSNYQWPNFHTIMDIPEAVIQYEISNYLSNKKNFSYWQQVRNISVA